MEEKKTVDQGEEKKGLRPLTYKEIGYIRDRVGGKTQRQAVLDNYNIKPGASTNTLDNMAAKIEKRPSVLAVLEKNQEEAQQTVLDVMRYSREIGKGGGKDGASYARVAVDGANSLLDRVHGKAKQQLEIQSTSLAISIDLTTAPSDEDEVIDQ